MCNCQFYEVEYLQTVNAFYTFWKEHKYDFPKDFLHYLSEGTLRNRLSLNPHDSTWYLL